VDLMEFNFDIEDDCDRAPKDFSEKAS